jgi:hypothetical protein
MSHFYKPDGKGGAKLLKSVETPAEARKHGNAYASVTTKIGIAPNSFINIWRENQIIQLARANPFDSAEEISKLAWGTRTHPNGNTVPSSDFGTELHAELELAANLYAKGEPYTGTLWLPFVQPWLTYLMTNDIEIVECEKMVSCDQRRVAGSIDVLAINHKNNDRYELYDFKSRQGNGKLSTKHYDKDAMQLAVEADIIQETLDLHYAPDTYSVLICTDTAEHYVKQWTKEAQTKALLKFDIVNDFYNQWYQL